jgi:hypothetical protein
MATILIIDGAVLKIFAEMNSVNIMVIERSLRQVPIDDALTRINSVNGQFFAIDFARKHDKKVDGVVVAKAGDIRHMVCRRGVGKYTKGVLPIGKRAYENWKNKVLTVWDVQVYQQLIKSGLPQEEAGSLSYRSINLADIKSISIAPIIEVKPEKVEVTEEVLA